MLYCVAFVVMDKQWLEKNATYMQFNVRMHHILTCFHFYSLAHSHARMHILQDVLKSKRAQLEKELMMDEVLGIEEMS